VYLYKIDLHYLNTYISNLISRMTEYYKDFNDEQGEGGSTRHEITLHQEYFELDDKEQEYHILTSTNPTEIACMDCYGMFCLVAFIGDGNTHEYGDEDFGNAIRSLHRYEKTKVVDGESSEKYSLELREREESRRWFYEFCNGDWDEAERQVNNDPAIRKKFYSYVSYYWKIVSDLILSKVRNQTYDTWIAGKRDEVADFLEKGIAENKINEQKYNASYKNYKQTYDFIDLIAKYYLSIIKISAEMIEKKGVDTSVKDWGIANFTGMEKNRVIYDREGLLHFYLKTTFGLVVMKKLFPDIPKSM